jgi:rod shape-determining protein MreD
VIVSFGMVVRVGLLLLVGLVLQFAVVSQVPLFGTNVDLTPLIVVSVALLAGPVAGSIVGFLAGLLVDMSLVETVGVTSLLLIGIGYLVGRYRELRDTSHGLVPPLAGFLATLFYAVALAITQFMLGVDSSVSALVIRDMIVQSILNALIAAPVFGVVRALLRPCLVDPWRPRRRRATTGLRPVIQ